MTVAPFPFPDPRTPVERAAWGANMHPDDLRDLLRLAGWNASAAVFESEGWFDRLKRDVVSTEIAIRVKAVGPVAARALTAEQCKGKIESPLLIRAAAQYNGGAALLLGKSGCGKTLAALMMARRGAAGLERRRLEASRDLATACNAEHRAAPPAVAWVSCAELPRLVSSHSLGSGQPRELQRAKTAPIVVLDDLTWGSDDKALLEIIAARYDAGLPSIATAGATRAQLVERFGDAVVRRLLECRGTKGLLVEVP